MRRIPLVLLVLLLSLALTFSTVLAGSPRIQKSQVKVESDGDLTVTFKEGGLGKLSLITYSLSGTAHEYFACLPPASGGTGGSTSSSETIDNWTAGSFTSAKNGSISGTIQISVPASSATCTPGYTRLLCSIQYTNILLLDRVNSVFSPFMDTRLTYVNTSQCP